MEPVCDIIVLTYNKVEVTKEFFSSLSSSTSLPVSVVVVDNGSSDGTRSYFKSLRDTELCKHRFIFNEENKGFVKGANQGFEISRAPYVCFANNDLIFSSGWLDEVISVFNKYETVGVLNPGSNTLGIDGNGGSARFLGKFIEMPFCSGFCMVVKREVLNKIGAFSEEYAPMFFEDSDLSIRALRAGYLIGVARGSYVWHKEHGSFRHKSAASENIFRKNREIFMKKWGKILRIAWVADNYQEALDSLIEVVELARQGNYITFCVKGIDICKEDIFKAKNIFEHSGVQFSKFGSYIGLVWRAILKKKKFDLVVCRKKGLRFVLSKLGYNVVQSLSPDLINKLKNRQA